MNIKSHMSEFELNKGPEKHFFQWVAEVRHEHKMICQSWKRSPEISVFMCLSLYVFFTGLKRTRPSGRCHILYFWNANHSYGIFEWNLMSTSYTFSKEFEQDATEYKQHCQTM